MKTGFLARVMSMGPPSPPKPIVYLTIGLSIDPPQIVMMGVSKSLWKAQANGIERIESEPQCSTIKAWEVFKFDDTFGERFRDWLLSNGASQASATQAVKDFGKVMVEILEDSRKIDAIEKPIRAQATTAVEIVERITKAQAARRVASVLRCDACGKEFDSVNAKAQHWNDKCGKANH